MANIRSPSRERTTTFVSIFDGGSSSKARLDARITKVSQTNIDDLFIGRFERDVNSCLTDAVYRPRTA